MSLDSANEVPEVSEVVETPAAVVPPHVLAQRAATKAFKTAMDAAAMVGVASGKMVIGCMKTDDFINLRRFAVNRDESRINSAKNTHLKGELTSEQQKRVAVILTSDKNRADFWDAENAFMRLDGNSRAKAWAEGKLDKPEFVYVEFYHSMTDAEICKEYEVFTESKAISTAAEKGRFRNTEQNYNPVSDFCKAYWKDAFSVVGGRGTLYEDGLKEHRAALDIIDSWMIKPEIGKNSTKRHTAGVKAAILNTFDSEDFENWEKFWKDFLSTEVDCSSRIAKTLRNDVLKATGTGSTYNNTIYNLCNKAFYKFDKANK